MVVGGKMCGVPMRELESDEDFWDESRDVPSFQMSFPNSPKVDCCITSLSTFDKSKSLPKKRDC